MGRDLEQILQDENPQVVRAAKDSASQMLGNIHLAKMRERMKMLQSDIATTLGAQQPTVSGMEQRGRDLRLSYLKRYFEASGGKVRLDIELPDGSHHKFCL